MSSHPLFQPLEGDRFCIICGKPFSQGRLRTCSDECHQRFIDIMVVMFGRFKKVVDSETGKTYRVPTREILEKGLKHEDLVKYPEWKEEMNKQLSKETLDLIMYMVTQPIKDFKIDQEANVSLTCPICESQIILPFRKGQKQECPKCDAVFVELIEKEDEKGFNKFVGVVMLL